MARMSTSDTLPRKPAVLVLATTVPAEPGDGTPEFVLLLAREMASDYEITLLCPRVRGAAKDRVVDGVRIRRFAYFPRRWEGLADGAILLNLRSQRWRLIEVPFLLTAFLVSAVRERRRTRAELVHAHWLVPGGIVARLVKASTRVPYVVTAHGVDVFGLRGRVFRMLKRWVMRGAAVVSPASAQMAEILGPPAEPGDVVPMGVEADEIADAVGRREPERGSFLFVGRLAEKKGVDVLIRAVEGVPDARLRIAGDGPDGADLQRLAKEIGADDRVEFLGHTSRRDVFSELRRAHAVVVPSRVASDGDADSTPLVMSEAMAAGVPVIASRLGGLAEQITSDENGLLVEPDSVDDLMQALRSMLDDPARAARWASVARERMRTSLDIRYTASRYRDFYERARRPR